MQRAAAFSPSSAPFQTPDTHSTKRQKLSNGAATPTSNGTSTPIPKDNTPRLPRPEGGETEWVLSLPKPATNGNGSSSEDEEDSIWAPDRSIGRQTYGSFKRRKATLATTNGAEDLSSLESGEEEGMHPLRPMNQPKDREREEEAQGRRMDRMNLTRMEGVSGSSSMTGAGMRMSKRNEGHRDKEKNSSKHRGVQKQKHDPKQKKRKTR
jgi:hypothetical protein